MKFEIVSGSTWEVANAHQGDLQAFLDDGWEPYAVTSHGGVIIHYLRRQV